MGSKNKDAQAQHEQATLDTVRTMLDEYDLNNFYGFTQKDAERLRSAFQSLQQNKQTTFPDFYSDSALVELFDITSSVEVKRGGSLQAMQDGELHSCVKRDIAEAIETGKESTRSHRRIHPAHSYENLTKSLRTHCLHHLDSLKKCEDSENKMTVFVIECREIDLYGAFKIVDGVSVGDLLPTYDNSTTRGLYRLSRDKDNLLWLQSELNAVDFVIFVGASHIEVINHHRADVIAAYLPWKVTYSQALAATVATSVPISIPLEEHNNEQNR